MATNLGTTKEVEAYARAARKAGWDVTISGKNHIKWRSPRGEMFMCALSFGDKRRIKKVEKFLTERGVKL